MNQKGKVIIAGAGPGDPELLTLKAASWLQKADVVLTDRLVSSEILERWVSPAATVINVGKEGKNKQSFKQEDIDSLLVHYAVQNKVVVRLKGGDVSFFSNVLDELATLAAWNIPFEIVPGITAAAGASAYAGIPLTARGQSRGVRMISHFRKEFYSDSYWSELAQTGDTLVFYMSGENIRNIALHLQSRDVDPEKKIAVIEQATTPQQRVSIYSFEEVCHHNFRHDFVNPSLIIIGKVVNLHHQFAWLENSHLQPEPYFPEPSEKNLLPEKSLIRKSA